MVSPKAVLLSGLYVAVLASPVLAAGPFGSIHVGNWNGGAYTNDQTGAFSHCSAATGYASGVGVLVGQNAIGNCCLDLPAQHFV